MVVHDNVFFIKNIYNDIHQQCVVKFFNYVAEKNAEIYEQIEKVCNFLLAEAAKKQAVADEVASQSVSTKKKKHKKSDVNMFAQAYKAPWPYDDIVWQEPDNGKNTSLKPEDWENGQSLYKALRRIGREKAQEIDINIEDIKDIMLRIAAILEQEQSPTEVKKNVEQVFLMYNFNFDDCLKL